MTEKGRKVTRLKKAVRAGKAAKKIAVIAVPILNAVSLLVLKRLLRDDK